jgi:hypothetical protein
MRTRLLLAALSLTAAPLAARSSGCGLRPDF